MQHKIEYSEDEKQTFHGEMLPLRCLPFLLFFVVVIYCDDEATETLIEMKGDKLDVEETTVPERVVADEDGKKNKSSKWMKKF